MEKYVMVVDDESSMRKVLKEALEREGYVVIEADGGKEALVLMQEIQPDLVILDIKMPEMDGFQVLEHIRRISEIPVIMLSGLGEVTTIHDALSAGADDFLKKPFHIRELVARVRAKMRREPKEQ